MLPCLSFWLLGGEGSPAYHIPRHTLGLGQLWPFQKHSAKNVSSISEPTKENTVGGGGRADGPQAGPSEGRQAGAAEEPVRHQVKYGLKASISISYINTLVQTGSRAGEREGRQAPQQHTDGQGRWAGGHWRGGVCVWGRGEAVGRTDPQTPAQPERFPSVSPHGSSVEPPDRQRNQGCEEH